MKFAKFYVCAAAGMTMLSGCVGSAGSTSGNWPVEEEKVYELGTKVILSPEAFLKSGADSESLKDVTIESDLKTDPAYDFIGFTNEVKTAGKDYLMPGEYTITLKQDNKTQPVKIIVRDTVAPAFVTAPRKMIVRQGDSGFDLASKFKADDYDEVTISEKGEYDINTPGEYSITITAADASGNTNELPIVLKVTGQNEIIDTTVAPEDLLILDSSTKQDDSGTADKTDKTEQTDPVQTDPADQPQDTPKKEETACTIGGIPASDNVYTSFEAMIAAGTSWNAQSPNNYFFYTAGADDCGNTVYILTTAASDEVPHPGTQTSPDSSTSSRTVQSTAGQ
ncbi:MAG: hypothetical protein HUJ55_02275 [Ileibacterium sp.]|nr:hypothetical protein [Ileibacterium sp.]